jgi:hypothetical protein
MWPQRRPSSLCDPPLPSLISVGNIFPTRRKKGYIGVNTMPNQQHLYILKQGVDVWLFLKRLFNDFMPYLIMIILILIGTAFLIYPAPKDMSWLPVLGGFVIGAGFTTFATIVSNRQAIQEQYKKEANLQRKTDVYGPLHAELKRLREIFDNAHAGEAPYPRWVVVPGEEPPLSLRYGNLAMLPMFSLWPTFKTDYRVDNFNPTAQKLLNEVQILVVACGKTVEDARKAMQIILRPHIATNIAKEEQRQDYKEYLQKRSENIPVNNRWFDFINSQTTTYTLTWPLGEGLSQSWARTIGWLLADQSDQAAQEIYSTDAIGWDASQHASFSWFQTIFQATESELKNDQAYQHMQDAQQKLFTKLQEAETMLYQGLLYIRNRYEGGVPPV